MEAKEEKKQKFSITKKRKQIIFCIVIALLIIIAGIIIALLSNDGKNNDKKEENEKTVVSNEETVENEYNFSKEDAINSVKSIFNSDNYEFSATTREDNMYIVTVKNTENKNEYIYIVDPNDGSFTMIEG